MPVYKIQYTTKSIWECEVEAESKEQLQQLWDAADDSLLNQLEAGEYELDGGLDAIQIMEEID